MRSRLSINWQLSERQPAIVAHPPAASLDEAHSAIELWEHYSRKSLDAEQRLAVELMMAETEDGRWAADTTGRAESRQNGKGDEIEVVELWGLVQRSEAILHTAHEAATAASAHMRMVGLIEGHRDLRVKVKKKQSWNGNYSLILTNGGTIVWRTRTGAGGRGLDDISRLVVDEAQHAQPEELASSSPILSVNPNPQKNFIGSGGVGGKSALWWRQRLRALSGNHGRFSWLEHSAEDVALIDGRVTASVGDVADPDLWMRANPAYPSRISHDFLLDQLKTLGADLFAREHLCVWDPDPSTEANGAWSSDAWAALADPQAERGNSPFFAVASAPDASWAAVAVAWKRPDGNTQVMIADYRPGTSWVKARMDELKRWGGTEVVDTASRALLPDAPHPSEPVAHNALRDAVEGGTVRHGNQGELNHAVRHATWVPAGDTRKLDRKGSADISPLAAAALAYQAAQNAPTTGGWMVGV